MCAGTNAGLSLLTLRITPNTEMIWFRTVCSLLTTIDIGLGPTISSLVAWELPPSTVQQHAAAVSYLFAAWWFLVMCWALKVIPSNFQPLCDAKLASDAAVSAGTATGGDDKDNEQSNAIANLSDDVRRGIWLKVMGYGLERAFVVSALEGLTTIA